MREVERDGLTGDEHESEPAIGEHAATLQHGKEIRDVECKLRRRFGQELVDRRVERRRTSPRTNSAQAVHRKVNRRAVAPSKHLQRLGRVCPCGSGNRDRQRCAPAGPLPAVRDGRGVELVPQGLRAHRPVAGRGGPGWRRGRCSALEATSSALIALRRVKPEAKMSPRTPFLAVTVRAPQAQIEALESVKGDLEAASKAVGTLTVAASDDAEATEASIESFELGAAPAKRKG